MQRRRILGTLVVTAVAAVCATAASQPAYADGPLKNVASGLCVGPVPHSSLGGTINGLSMFQWSCDGLVTDPFSLLDWRVEFHSVGPVRGLSGGWNRFRIRNLGGTFLKCLDNRDGSLSNGNVMQQWDCNNSTSMLWTRRQTIAGGSEWVNARSGKCLDIRGGSLLSGTLLQQYTCTSTPASPNLAQLFTGV